SDEQNCFQNFAEIAGVLSKILLLEHRLLIPSAPIHCGFWEQYRNLMCNKDFVVLYPARLTRLLKSMRLEKSDNYCFKR
ncbi:hypothetical protein O0K47_09855, partial [Staphylococcus pseudintermedius]|nr:hypothetical protein [Staphylococcus pseudintermedius]